MFDDDDEAIAGSAHILILLGWIEAAIFGNSVRNNSMKLDDVFFSLFSFLFHFGNVCTVRSVFKI